MDKNLKERQKKAEEERKSKQEKEAQSQKEMQERAEKAKKELQERKEKAEKERQEQEKERKRRQKKAFSNISIGKDFEEVNIKPVLDWKQWLLAKEDEDRVDWSYRRSTVDTGFSARPEEMEMEDRPDTEVMLDVSGSVDIHLLREFLRQLKPLLKLSKLKVGCFDEFVYDFEEIKTNEDIDHFQITAKSQWTENWDAAVRAFSKDRDVNKIVFTDGQPCPGTMPKEDLKNENIIWIVYGNENFTPCCGKVFQVRRKEFEDNNQSLITAKAGKER